MQMTFRDSQVAFAEAIAAGRLSTDPQSAVYAGHFMYMGAERHAGTRGGAAGCWGDRVNKIAALKRQPTCVWCDRPWIEVGNIDDVTIEHLVPVRRGGCGPRALACWKCNHSRAGKDGPPQESKRTLEQAIEFATACHYTIRRG